LTCRDLSKPAVTHARPNLHRLNPVIARKAGYVKANDGVRLYYEDTGAGRPIVLIHGGGLSMGWWNKQIPGLSPQFRVVAADTRGNGRSTKTSWGHRTARYAMDVKEIIDSLDLDGVTLVGWSIGARTVLSYIELFRDYRLRGAVLVDETPCAEVHDPPASDGEPEPEDKHQPGDDEIRRRRQFRQMLVGIEVTDGELDRLLAESRGNTPAQGVTLGPDYEVQDWRPLLPSIILPVMITTGKKSGAFPGCLHMARNIPGARLEIFENCGHALFYEDPDRFNAVIADFVHNLP